MTALLASDLDPRSSQTCLPPGFNLFPKTDPLPTRTHNRESPGSCPQEDTCVPADSSSHPGVCSVPRLRLAVISLIICLGLDCSLALGIGRVGSLVPWTELGRHGGGLGLDTLILSIYSLSVKAWRTGPHDFLDPRCVSSTPCPLEACPKGQPRCMRVPHTLPLQTPQARP